MGKTLYLLLSTFSMNCVCLLYTSYRATIYRTDELGDILAYSDGKKVLFAKPGTAPTPASEKIDTVYITSSGKSYHRKGCQYYNDQSIALTVEEAKNLGYQACTKCMQN